MPPNAEPFRFIVVSDLHHATPECDAFFAGLMSEFRRHEPELVLVVGDLSDVGRPESLAAMREILGGLGVPYYPVPGNHDCDVEQSPRLFAEYFPGRLNYTFRHRGWQFIAFDSTEGNHWQNTRVAPEVMRWLEQVVNKSDPAAPTIAFTHFPLGEGVRFQALNAGEVLTTLARLNVRAVFCGHYHSATERIYGGFPVLTHPCCSRVQGNHDGTRTEGFVVCTAHPDGRLERRFVEFAPASLSGEPIVL